MSKNIPTVQKFMTYNPVTIDAAATIEKAQQVMKEKQIRHLPVLLDGEIWGVITDRDVKMASSFIKINLKDTLVKDVAHAPAYVVHANTPLDMVGEEMASKHYGCAIIQDNNKVVGIFTTVDACRAIGDILHQRYHGA